MQAHVADFQSASYPNKGRLKTGVQFISKYLKLISSLGKYFVARKVSSFV